MPLSVVSEAGKKVKKKDQCKILPVIDFYFIYLFIYLFIYFYLFIFLPESV